MSELNWNDPTSPLFGLSSARLAEELDGKVVKGVRRPTYGEGGRVDTTAVILAMDDGTEYKFSASGYEVDDLEVYKL